MVWVIGWPRGVGMVRKWKWYLLTLLGGAKELGIVYINIIRGAKEPRNLQNHTRVKHQCL